MYPNLLLQQQYRAAKPAIPPTPALAIWSDEQIAQIIGSPLQNVEEHWPIVYDRLEERNTIDITCQVAVLATIGVEAAVFAPIHEYGDYVYFESNYGYHTAVGRQLGNIYPGDGALFHGRGLVQITGRGNYARYGPRIGMDLIAYPDEALNPYYASQILALYFDDRDIWGMARNYDWRAVRRAVNGGYNGWDRFSYLVNYFLGFVSNYREVAINKAASMTGMPYVWDGDDPSDGGFDCSGLVTWAYGLAGITITSFTDAAYNETVPTDNPQPGDLVFYQYHDPGQPGVRYPHMGFWLNDQYTLDSRGGYGVGIHHHLLTAREVRRIP